MSTPSFCPLSFAGACCACHLPALCHCPPAAAAALPALADGSLHDACLLAALAALSSLRLRAVSIDEAGSVQPAPAAAQQQGQQPAGQQERRLALSCLPVSLTCGLYRGRLLADPTAEEEPLLEGQLTATLDEGGAVLGAWWRVPAVSGCAVRTLVCGLPLTDASLEQAPPAPLCGLAAGSF